MQPKTASQKVKWKTSDKKVATVSSKGKVKAKKAGKATITCYSAKNKKIRAVCKVTVKKGKRPAAKQDQKTDNTKTADEKAADTGSKDPTASDGKDSAGSDTGSKEPDAGDKKEPTVAEADRAEMEAIKKVLGITGEPLNQRFQGKSVSSRSGSSGQTIWSTGTSANGVLKSIKVYDGYTMTGYTYCNAWGSPSVTYSKEVQADNAYLKDGSYAFAADPAGLLAGWGVWTTSTTLEEFQKMINATISSEVFELVKATNSNSFYFSASGGGNTIILYGKNTKGQLVGKYAGVVSYNMTSNALYFRVKGINPENTEDYGQNFYEDIRW